MANGLTTTDDLGAGTPAWPAPKLGEWRDRLFGALLILSLALNWVMRWPYLPFVVFHMVLPWISIALAACFPGDFILSITKNEEPRRGLVTPWIFLPITYLAVFDTTRLAHTEQAVYLGCAIGAVFFVAIILVNLRCRIAQAATGLVVLALFSGVYGCGLVRELNIELDRSPGAVQQMVVFSKSIISTQHRVSYMPWGSSHPTGTIFVTSSLYHSVQPGARICMVLKQGALGMSWYTAQACPWNGKIEFP
jgi:hypothetical protein